MELKEFINKTKASGSTSLNEYDSKQVLSAYGIPTVSETVADSIDTAVSAAAAIGYPAVIKGHGSKLTHKTERNLVFTGLADPDQVKSAAKMIQANAGRALEGFLLQPHVAGRREWIAGLSRDPQFGPVVMFGAGGILSEAISDVTFRLAPLSSIDAMEMIAEIKSSALLADFRGERKVDPKQLGQILMALGKLGDDHTEIVEVDINPLITTPDGELVAVDALVILDTEQKVISPVSPSLQPETLRPFFYPRSIAFIGASANLGKWGHMLVANTISGGYQGKLHLVNSKGGTIIDQQAYQSVAEIQDPVDLAIVTIPAKHVISLIPQLAAKGIHHMLLITSGFSETDAAGKKLEKELVTSAREAGIQILGPNTMGICNPHVSLNCTSLPVKPRAGTTALVSQSGNMGTQFLAFAEHQGIGIRGFCGSGNEAMTTIEDFLEAFESDELTKTVMLYLESVKDGRRFYETARRLGKLKPVILMKGGQSKAGRIAASSHTGALSTDARIFDAVCRQAGIVKVEQSMDLLDLAAAFSSLPLPKGNRVGVMTLGGGWGVVTADLCNAYNLDVPKLSNGLIKQIDKLLPPYWSRSNPIDLVGEHNEQLPLTIIEALLKWEDCDAVINLGIMGRKHLVGLYIDAVRQSDPGYDDAFLNDIQATLSGFEEQYVQKITRLMQIYRKPIIGVSLLTDAMDRTVYMVKDSPFRGVFYTTPERAVKTLARMVEYGRYRSGSEDSRIQGVAETHKA